jgi:hypothetical protein
MSYPGAGYHSYKQQRVQQQQQQKFVSSTRLLVVLAELTHGLPTAMDLRPVSTEAAAGTEDRPRSVTVPTQVLRQGRLPGSTGRRTVHRLRLDSTEEEEEEDMTHRLVNTEEEEEDTTQESRLATRPATSSRCRIRIRISTSQSLTPFSP